MKWMIPLIVVTAGCAIDTGTERVEATLQVRGTDASTFEGRDGWQVELSTAELAFGPVYLCSGVQAGDLCESSRGELLEAVIIDALDPDVHELATFEALDGPVRSAMWDYGITWGLPQVDAQPSPAAEALGGSVYLEGVARREDVELPFVATIPLRPNLEGRTLVRAADLFEHELSEGDVLEVSVDPSQWLAQVRFEDLVGAHSVSSPAHFAPDTQPWRSVSNALTTRAKPRLTWNP